MVTDIAHLFTDMTNEYQFLAVNFVTYFNRTKFNTNFRAANLLFRTVVNNMRHNY
jgi:hypothetical protein